VEQEDSETISKIADDVYRSLEPNRVKIALPSSM
jgi:hypothetical protein